MSEPARGLSTGLTVPVLRALSRRTAPLSASQVWRAAGHGTLAGTQRSCERLVEHGLLERDEIAGRTVYTLNYDHVLYDAAVALLQADDVLPSRLTAAIEKWDPRPTAALLFGSVARWDGDTGSDIDLLLVRPMLSGAQRTTWARNVADLRRDVRRWTGNRLSVVDRTRAQVRRLAAAGDPIVDEWRSDSINVWGLDIDVVVGRQA